MLVSATCMRVSEEAVDVDAVVISDGTVREHDIETSPTRSLPSGAMKKPPGSAMSFAGSCRSVTNIQHVAQAGCGVACPRRCKVDPAFRS